MRDFAKLFGDMKTEFVEALKKELIPEIDSFFVKYPELSKFSFRAYTDYFNDGDTCYYHVHCEEDHGVSINGGSHWDTDFEDGSWQDKFLGELVPIIRAIPKDLFRDAFGDHIEITFEKGKITIDDYTDHD